MSELKPAPILVHYCKNSIGIGQLVGTYSLSHLPIYSIWSNSHAVWEGTFHGKHIGKFAGIPATGKEVRVPLCVVYDLVNDQIKEGRIYSLPRSLLYVFSLPIESKTPRQFLSMGTPIKNPHSRCRSLYGVANESFVSGFLLPMLLLAPSRFFSAGDACVRPYTYG
jgi:hypothetical protein